MDIPKRCDVVVIGGGPGGSMAATFLAQKGYDAVLLERQKHPRYMVGESLIPQFWKYCDLAKVSDKIVAEGFVQKQGGTVVWDGVIRQSAFKDFGYTRPALHVERDRFDHILLEHARTQGARVFEEVSVLSAGLGSEASVTYRPAGEDAVGEISCRFVVDASGQRAVIGRQLGVRIHDEDYPFRSVWGYFTGSKYVALDGNAYPHEKLSTVPPTTFICGTGDWGWSWHIPLREKTSVGLVVPIERMESARVPGETLEDYFVRRCSEIPHLNRLLENATYCTGQFHAPGPYSYRPKQLCGPGFFLVGDAAAFIDPILSEGCLLAMYSAYLAAWAIDRSLKDPRRIAESQAFFTRQFAGRYELGHALMLTPYGASTKMTDVARHSIQFDSSREQELMYVALTMAGRSENLLRLFGSQDKRRVAADKYRTLERLGF